MLGVRAQLGYVQGFGGDVAPPNNRFYDGGEQQICAASTFAAPRPTVTCPRGSTSSSPIPTAVAFRATQPIRKTTSAFRCRCRFTASPPSAATPDFTANAEYRIPVVGPFTFAFFDDFGIDSAVNHNQLKQSPEGFASLTAPLYGCPVFNNGACQGGIPGSQVGFRPDIRPVAGTNFVPRMSIGAELSVLMPIINAPFRLYYAYNPLRLYETALIATT